MNAQFYRQQDIFGLSNNISPFMFKQIKEIASSWLCSLVKMLKQIKRKLDNNWTNWFIMFQSKFEH